MLANYDLIKFELSKLYETKEYAGTSNIGALYPPLFLHKSTKIKDGHFYICDDNSLISTHKNAVIITCDPSSFKKIDSSCTILQILNCNDKTLLFNQIQNIYASLEEWTERLNTMIDHPNTIQNLLDAGSFYIDNYLIISSINFEQIFSSMCGNSYFVIDEKWKRKLNSSDFNFMKENLLINREKRGVQWIKQPDWEYELMYANIFDGDIRIGTIALLPVKRNLHNRDLYLLNVLSKYIQWNMTRSIHLKQEKIVQFSHFLQKIMNDEHSSKEQLSAWLNAVGFESNSTYRCFCIPIPADMKNEYEAFLSLNIQQKYPKSIIFPYKEYLLIIFNTDLKEDYTWLSNHLKDVGLKAGKSELFSDLNKLKYYFTEACAALDLNKDTDSTIVDFYSYKEDYILKNCCGNLLPEMIYSKGFKQLLSYNENSSVDYIETLKVHLEEYGNEAKAAKKLYICRNTFMYRLNQLNSLLKEELNTFEGRFHLALCIQLYKKKNNRVEGK